MCLCWKDAFSSPVRASHSLALKSAEAVAVRTACGSSVQDHTHPCSGTTVCWYSNGGSGVDTYTHGCRALPAATADARCTSSLVGKVLLTHLVALERPDPVACGAISKHGLSILASAH
jgi:hypothetical protein